jgi:uncharacterized protein YndB with AHSA1/START domain
MSEKKENDASHVSGRRIKINRLVNAPRDLVWKMWTEAEHIKHWWGPQGFTNSISKMDVKEGGEWEFIMHGPDGTDYKNKHVYREILPPEKLVLEHVTGPRFRMTARFEARGDQTLIHIESEFESPEQLQEVIRILKADKGLEENMDRLENYLFQHQNL